MTFATGRQRAYGGTKVRIERLTRAGYTLTMSKHKSLGAKHFRCVRPGRENFIRTSCNRVIQEVRLQGQRTMALLKKVGVMIDAIAREIARRRNNE